VNSPLDEASINALRFLAIKARIAMDAACAGIIFGRNMWQRSWDDALASCRRMHDLFARYADGSPA
jgi:hypothetical protein